MQAIEFEATAHDHFIRIPDTAPDGVPLRVILLVDEPVEKTPTADDKWKALLSSMPDVGADEDFLSQKDYGRENIKPVSAPYSSENLVDELRNGKTISPITQSLIGLLANSNLDELDYKKHLEDKYL
jgi:hypothetical protein